MQIRFSATSLERVKNLRALFFVHFETWIFEIESTHESPFANCKVFDLSFDLSASLRCNDAEDFVALCRASGNHFTWARITNLERETRRRRRRKIDKKCDIVNGSVLLIVFQTYWKTNWGRTDGKRRNVKFLTTSREIASLGMFQTQSPFSRTIKYSKFYECTWTNR